MSKLVLLDSDRRPITETIFVVENGNFTHRKSDVLKVKCKTGLISTVVKIADAPLESKKKLFSIIESQPKYKS